MIKDLLALPRTVWLLGLVSLFNDSTSELVYPLVPLFLASVLMAGPRALGLIEGTAEATAALLKIVSGALTDQSGRRKPFMILGYGLSGLSRPLIGLAQGWPFVLVCRFADRVGKGLRTSPRDALIADWTPPEIRGAAFGLHRGMDHLGAVLGPLAAAALLAAGIGYRPEDLAAIPAGANLGLGCGAPLQFLDLQEGETVLDAALSAGVAIPTLCFHGSVRAHRACRVCTVEVIRGEKTSNETMQLIYDLCLRMGKVPVRVEKDTPGYRLGKKENKLGLRASATGEVIFESAAGDQSERAHHAVIADPSTKKVRSVTA